VWENIVGWGELTSVALTEDSRFLITAGSNTVVSVFRLDWTESEQRLSKSKDQAQGSIKSTFCPLRA
jgi:hypothetical protein